MANPVPIQNQIEGVIECLELARASGKLTMNGDDYAEGAIKFLTWARDNKEVMQLAKALWLDERTQNVSKAFPGAVIVAARKITPRNDEDENDERSLEG